MDKYLIKGGKKLKGRVRISGSKNSALPILVATLLTDEKCVINNVPDLADIRSICALLEHLGKNITVKGNSVSVASGLNNRYTAPYSLVRKMRASFLVSGPLLAIKKKANVSLPGGCSIGLRPVNIHIDAFKKLGAKIEIRQGYVYIKARELKPKHLVLAFPSVGATENLMMAAVLLNGRTVIENAAREPEIADLADFLNKMGASVEGAGTSKIVIDGVNALRGAGHNVIPDRIEAATYLIAAAAAGGGITLLNANAEHIKQVIGALSESGAKIRILPSGDIAIKSANKIRPVSVRTSPYPGFPTDAQAQWMALMSVADGSSVIEENVFENRFLHAAEINRMGARLIVKGRAVTAMGVKELYGAPVMVSDLRAGAALVIAGLMAKGETAITRIYHLDRGYEKLHLKLKKLGANIKRLKE